jgi:hypothetical protein
MSRDLGTNGSAAVVSRRPGLGLSVVLGALMTTQAFGQAAPGGGGAGGGAGGGGAATPGVGNTSASIQESADMVLDPRNRTLTITTTPSNHRKIRALLSRVTQDPLAGSDVKMATFNLMSLTQQEFYNLVRYQLPQVKPEQRDRLLFLPETRNRTVQQVTIPQGRYLPALGGGSSSGGGGAGTGGGNSDTSGSFGAGGGGGGGGAAAGATGGAGR